MEQTKIKQQNQLLKCSKISCKQWNIESHHGTSEFSWQNRKHFISHGTKGDHTMATTDYEGLRKLARKSLKQMLDSTRETGQIRNIDDATFLMAVLFYALGEHLSAILGQEKTLQILLHKAEEYEMN